MCDFKAAIFDLDGTLLDSMGVWYKIDVDFLAKRGYTASDEYVRSISVLTFRQAAEYTIDLFNLDELPEDIMSEWYDMAISEYSFNVGLKPFAAEYLALLKSAGIKTATATGLSKILAEPALKNNSLHDFFDAQCFSDEVNVGKEFPDVYLLAAKRLNVKPEECIVFEDLPAGVISAKKAGMKVYCVYDSGSKAFEPEMKEISDGYLYDFKNAPLPF